MNEETKLINLDFVNAYLLKANQGYILIDTGLSMHWSRLEAELTAAGCLPNHLNLVIITHGDLDHVGNCAELQKKYHARIAIHAGDVEMVRTGIPLKRKTKSLRGKLFRLLRTIGKSAMPKPPTFEPDIVLKDGQELSEYGLSAHVLHTPGHTKGSIAIVTNDGRLFCGDTIQNRTKPDITPYIENEQELYRSISELKKIKAHTIYPGHGRSLGPEELAGVH
jgi:glyoxylase-like metal-dependent hydrolase (beta-lactamase superfamily II)